MGVSAMFGPLVGGFALPQHDIRGAVLAFSGSAVPVVRPRPFLSTRRNTWLTIHEVRKSEISVAVNFEI